jgi:hypothetical protein
LFYNKYNNKTTRHKTMADNDSVFSSYFGSEYGQSVYTKNSITSKERFNKEEQDDKKKTKAGLHTIKRRINGRMKKITLFNTAETINSVLINAITGIPYYNDGGKLKYRVGTAQEHDVFKVKFLTGENNVPGIVLCYDSPEQYERHLMCKLDDSIKQKWHNKNCEYKKRNSNHISFQ